MKTKVIKFRSLVPIKLTLSLII